MKFFLSLWRVTEDFRFLVFNFIIVFSNLIAVIIVVVIIATDIIIVITANK